MTDQTFREIQLSGKQLVFAFMASVVVLVAAFLLGVSVGRGVRQTVPPGTDVVASDPPAPATLPPPTETKPGDLTYHDKLQGQPPAKPGEQPPPPAETTATANGSKPATPPPSTTAPPPATTPPAPVVTPPAANPGTAAKPEPPAAPPQTAANTAKPAAEKPAPAKGGYVLQVGLFRSRENANSLAADLKRNGYSTMITTSSTGTFVVRVGPYGDRAEAERIQAKLLRERGEKPLIQPR